METSGIEIDRWQKREKNARQKQDKKLNLRNLENQIAKKVLEYKTFLTKLLILPMVLTTLLFRSDLTVFPTIHVKGIKTKVEDKYVTSTSTSAAPNPLLIQHIFGKHAISC